VSTAIDAHASRILRLSSPSSACIDSSLGPYVTSILRCSSSDGDDDVAVGGYLDNLPEFEGLMELVMEHCCMSRDVAKKALQSIFVSVKTGRVNEAEEKWSSGSEDSVMLWEQMLPGPISNTTTGLFVNYEVGKNSTPESSLSPFPYGDSPGLGKSPFKASTFLPCDLLAVMDDPSTPATMRNPRRSSSPSIDANFDESIRKVSLDHEPPEKKSPVCSPCPSPPCPPSSPQASATDTAAKDLAACLFTSRSRSNSTTARSRSNSTTDPPPRPSPMLHPSLTPLQQSTAQLLHSYNPELSEDAVASAAMASNGDATLAQYLIETAKNAPPVCRHMLNNACYRSDCQFSHDVEGHTCLFWLRGRCGKGESCRFMHGYNIEAMETFEEMQCVSVSTPMVRRRALSIDEYNYRHKTALMSTTPIVTTPLSASSPTFIYENNNIQETKQETNKENEGDSPKFSFASVASKGYSKASFSKSPPSAVSTPSPSNNSRTSPTFAKIPMELWTVSPHRNSSMFNITDPIKRYHEVSLCHIRKDVLDLHFQSLKTLPVVLKAILPGKLRECGEVWIVTGNNNQHVSKGNKGGGGVLEKAVVTWLKREGYVFLKGRDKHGCGGALLVKHYGGGNR